MSKKKQKQKQKHQNLKAEFDLAILVQETADKLLARAKTQPFTIISYTPEQLAYFRLRDELVKQWLEQSQQIEAEPEKEV
jgi:hypothetical protein